MPVIYEIKLPIISFLNNEWIVADTISTDDILYAKSYRYNAIFNQLVKKGHVDESYVGHLEFRSPDTIYLSSNLDNRPNIVLQKQVTK